MFGSVIVAVGMATQPAVEIKAPCGQPNVVVCVRRPFLRPVRVRVSAPGVSVKVGEETKAPPKQ